MQFNLNDVENKKIKAQQQKKQQSKINSQAQEYRTNIIAQICTQQARQRCNIHSSVNKIKTVKPEKAIKIQNSLIQLGQSGRLQGKITQKQLIEILQKQSASKQQQKISFKRHSIDDDW